MITLYHAPRSRSSSIVWLLEEIGAPYEIALTPIVYGDGRGTPAPETYRRIHPHKKVPAIDHDGKIVFESAAITLYLADALSLGTLAPKLDDPKRADYLTWIAYYAATFGPIVAARFRGWDSESPTGFGTLEELDAHLGRTLEAHPYVVGDEFTAADTLVGGAVAFFKGTFLPTRPAYDAYVERLMARAGRQRALAKDNG